MTNTAEVALLLSRTQTLTRLSRRACISKRYCVAWKFCEAHRVLSCNGDCITEHF